ncbi:hypothetical protein BZG36_02099 [Bifiguratus adelaidae]|uniref:Survival factor 1 n=1 Tax=Bifiguratus adelaidae TaxID=1938954 RepID=A0A261Y370_9FUNG|nr:hypothetical protein BZG36_02099 [Bifiguratus adelaidae]
MSWFSGIQNTLQATTGYDLGASNSVQTIAETAGDKLYSELTPQDLEWTLASGAATENQVFYVTMKNGGFAFVQMIHSTVGSLWNPTIQLTSRMYDPTTDTNTFKTINLSKFELSEDRRSAICDNMSIKLDPDMTTYKISITQPELIVDITFERIDKGFKIGEGKTYLGGNAKSNSGFVSHRFWPKAKVTGTFIMDGKLHDIDGDGMFIHAVQGMQPHLIASRWNFVDFQAAETSLTMMNFLTTKQYGGVEVNQGALVYKNRLISVSVKNGVELADLKEDPDTGYQVPQKITYTWNGKTLDEAEDEVKVTLEVNVSNLLDKIDVLNEIPWFIKKVVNVLVAKPFIYQWLDSAVAEISVGGEQERVEGKCFHELVFVSAL